MSLTVDGVWKVGVWATTVWADGVWREGAPTPPPPADIPMGGAGWPSTVYHQGRRKKRTLADQPNEHLRRILNRAVAEYYGEIVTAKGVSPEVKAEAGELVKPFVGKKARKADVPKPAQVDWQALQRDAEAVASIIQIWNEEIRRREIDDDDEELLMLYH